MPNDLLNITLDEELVTYRRRRGRADRKAPFFIAGTGQTNRNGESMDLIRSLAHISPAGHLLLATLIDARVVENNTVMRAQLMKHVNARYVDNHMPPLIRGGFVKRLQRGVYILNPKMVMPPNGTEARMLWAGCLAPKNNCSLAGAAAGSDEDSALVADHGGLEGREL